METKILRNSTTQTISINKDYSEAFDYISEPLNQKEWAINFIKDIRETNEGLVALTPFGESKLKFNSDKNTGLIDIVMGDAEPIPTRLIKNQNGCEYIFTLFQPNEMPDEVWSNAGINGLKEELETLRNILES